MLGGLMVRELVHGQSVMGEHGGVGWYCGALKAQDVVGCFRDAVGYLHNEDE